MKQQASWPWHSKSQTLALESSQPLLEWVGILVEQPESLTDARAAVQLAVLTLSVSLACKSSVPLRQDFC